MNGGSISSGFYNQIFEKDCAASLARSFGGLFRQQTAAGQNDWSTAAVRPPGPLEVYGIAWIGFCILCTLDDNSKRWRASGATVHWQWHPNMVSAIHYPPET